MAKYSGYVYLVQKDDIEELFIRCTYN